MLSLTQAETVTVSRPAAASFVDGEAVPGSNSSFTIKASVQELTGDQLQQVEEGFRNRQLLVFYTTAGLKKRDTLTRVLDGNQYELIFVKNQRIPGHRITHFEATGVLVDP